MLRCNKCGVAIIVFIVFQLINIAYSQCSIFEETDNKHEEVYSWFKTVDFVWPNKTFEIQAKRANRNKLGIPIGIKVFQKRIYLTLPRWSGSANIPANLVWTTRPQTNCLKENSSSSPKLR